MDKIKQLSVASIAGSLGKLSQRWLKKDFSFRKKAVLRLTKHSGFTREMSEALLDSIFSELTTAKLMKLMRAEIHDPRFLDGFRKEPVSGNFCRAAGPETILHIFSGNVPNPSILSFVLGMLIKSKNVGKCSSKDEGFLDLYLESLKALDPELASANRLLISKDRAGLEKMLAAADLVVAYGDDKTMAELRTKTPPDTPFFGYGHKVSFSFYTRQSLTRQRAESLAKKTAFDIWMLDQRGCLSPGTVFLEAGGETAPIEFAGLLAKHLEKLSHSEKLADDFIEVRAASHRIFKNNFKIQRLKDKSMRLWEGRKGSWIVVYDPKGREVSHATGRQVVFVKPVRTSDEFYKFIKPLGRYLQAVAVEADTARRTGIAGALSALGVNRVCRAGKMQTPPVFWHHDGLPNFTSWLKWTDLEN